MGEKIKIEFKNVSKRFGDLVVLDNVSLNIPEGMIYGLVGQSGAGKSTLLRSLNRLENIDSGNILVEGVDITKLSGVGLRNYRKKVAMIFQNFALLETQNVYKNVALPLICNHVKPEEVKKKVMNLLEIVGLTDKVKSRPKHLSGGQKQRVAIARALTMDPDIILCDEATSALDPSTTKSILELLMKINKELNITIVIVTHQMEVVKEVCERIAIIKDGHIIEEGLTADIFLSSNKALKDLVNDEAIIPSSGKNIQIYFPKSSSEDTLITKMAHELDINFSIVWGKLEKFQNDVLGSLIINVNDDDVDKVIVYLNSKKANYEVISQGDINE